MHPIAYCEPEIADGILWPRTVESTSAAISCSQASSQFRRETQATRRCLDNSMWAAADLTSCTLRGDAEPFLLVWFVIETNTESDDILLPALDGFADDGTPDSETRQLLEAEVCVEFSVSFVFP